VVYLRYEEADDGVGLLKLDVEGVCQSVARQAVTLNEASITREAGGLNSRLPI
jgi:hypothetical protein